MMENFVILHRGLILTHGTSNMFLATSISVSGDTLVAHSSF